MSDIYYRFLNTSLANLVLNLSESGADKFKILNGLFDPDKVKLLLKKLVYPYEYITSRKVFEESELPEKAAFKSTLTGENISGEDYDRAKLIWKTFNLKNLG